MYKYEFKKRCAQVKYTWRHKIAFLRVEKGLTGHNTIRGYLHDTDKLVLYWIPWMSKANVHKFHRAHSRHHLENSIRKSYKDYVAMIIDWECARATKPDKPLNAYETLMRFYPQHRDAILPVLQRLLPEQIQR